MNWTFWKKRKAQQQSADTKPQGGFAVGDLVYHKVSGKSAAILYFRPYQPVEDDVAPIPGAVVVTSEFEGCEVGWSLAEITKDKPTVEKKA